MYDFNFTPVANETLGSWGKTSMKFLQDLESRIAERTGEKSQLATCSKDWE